MSEQLIYHKKTFFPSSYLAAQFYNFNSEQIYFSSGNKLILFDVIKNEKIFRINLKGKKIIYFSQSDIDNDELFVLDIDNCFYQFKISTKEVVSSLQLNKENKYYTFQKINNKIYFYNNFSLSIAEIVLTDKGTEIKLVKEYSILSQKIQSNIVKEKDSLNKPCQFSIKNDILITSYENILLVHNLVNKSTTQINFYKKITTLSFLSDDYSICLGDSAGKIHILSDVTDKNYVISTKHWHSHRVNCVLSEENGHNLYTAGQEGVVVIWDLNSNIKNFLPRLNGNIVSLKISKDRKYFMCYMSTNTIKIVSLSEMKIVNEISSIPDNTDISRCTLFTSKQQYLTFLNKESGLLQFYNIGQNTFPFYLNILNKNYSSKTENEQLNFKQLTNVAFSSNKNNKEESYMLTSEEINYNETTRTTYLKFWKVTQDNIELLCSAENSHLNERIFSIEGNNYVNTFITCSESYFKVWEMNKESKYTCIFMSRYKNTKVRGATISKNKTIYALFDKYLIQYESKKIKRVYLLPIEGDKLKLLKDDTLLCIYSKKDIVLFDISSWSISWRESSSILKVIENTNTLDVLIQKTENVVYLVKYSLDTYKEIEDEGMIIEKKNLKYIDVYKKYLVIVNTKNDIYIAGREGVKKEEIDDKDIEL